MAGAGKTSFVRAGVVASRPSGWAAVVTTAGTSPFLMLGQALAPELQGDVEALRRLERFEDPGEAFETLVRWRKAHAEALLVVDLRRDRRCRRRSDGGGLRRELARTG